MKLKRLQILCIFFLMFTIGACAGKVEVSKRTATPTLATRATTAENTPTRIATTHPPYPPTPVPTLQPMQEQKVIEMLNSKDCKLPCYLGISPQETSVDEARQILTSMGGRYNGAYFISTGGIIYTYYLNMSANSSGSSNIDSVGISQSIDIYSSSNEIEAISVLISAEGSDAMAKALSIWDRYTVKGVFQELGVPDYVYFNLIYPMVMNGRQLLIGYESKGVIAEIYGSGEINYLCPQRNAEFSYTRLVLFQDYSFVEKYSSSIPMQLPNEQDAWVPMEDELKITVYKFFSSVMNNAIPCFVVKS